MSGGYFGDFEAGIQSKGGDVERGASKVGPDLKKVLFFYSAILVKDDEDDDDNRGDRS